MHEHQEENEQRVPFLAIVEKNVTVIASLSTSGIGECLILDGSANSDLFILYIEQILAPSLRPGQIVIMDRFLAYIRGKRCENSGARSRLSGPLSASVFSRSFPY